MRASRRTQAVAAESARGAAQGGSVRSGANGSNPWLVVRGARHNNLKNIDAAFPIGRFTCVTGVSGSGKSSLVNDILYAALARELNGAETRPGEYSSIEVMSDGGRKARRHEGTEGPGDRGTAGAGAGARGLAARRRTSSLGRVATSSLSPHLDKIIAIDQSPIGRTPRSNPATYIKLFDEIRDLFARLPDAKLRGYKPGRFSFNVAGGPKGGGRCEACEGNGANRIELDFLADVWVTCPVCEGRRFTRETLQIRYGEHRRAGGYSIADVLELDVQEALAVFESQPRIRTMLQTLHDVGLDYIKIGQPSTTLSGGEAQRIKLARELVKRPTGRTVYVLDEPTTGLHFEDIRRLLAVLHGFVDAGNTVIVIEHNLDVLKTADWIIDLGPEGGEAGGWIVAEGTPEEVAAKEGSYTGEALRGILAGDQECSMRSAECRTPTAPPGTEEAPGREENVEECRTQPDRTIEAGAKSSAFCIHRSEFITVRGARQHNLKDISVSFPRERMTVCTGVSGSGKTSFAIDTVFTEGYRRYVESLSAYARQFLGQMAKPAVEHIEGLSPAICIEQRAAGKSPRSTVGTVTEIYDYMRVLWARVGQRCCPTCGIPIGAQSVDEICSRVFALEAGAPIMILAPVALGDGETYAALFNRLKASGYARVRIDGVVQPTAQAATLDVRRKHRIDVVVDRTVVRTRSHGRITESVEHALALGNGVMTLVVEPVERMPRAKEQGGSAVAVETREGTGDEDCRKKHAEGAARAPGEAQRELLFSQKLACTRCGTSYEELSPHHYSFNSPLGWCETCEGLGVQRGAPAASIIRYPDRTLFGGAIAGWPSIERRSPFGRVLAGLCGRLGVSPNARLSEWTASQKQALLYGTSGEWMDAGGGYRFHWRGFFPAIDAAMRNSFWMRQRLHNVVTDIPCIACRGGRLRPDAAATTLVGRTLVEVCNLPLMEAAAFFTGLRLDARQKRIAGELLLEIRNRLQFLIDVGLDYVTLHRAAPTLSGGEAQRIRLASQIGSGLSGVLYVLDEPTIGLHPRDTQRLINALLKLRGLGNTLLMVEHDRDVIRSADHVLDFGPRAGGLGGQIVAEGPPAELMRAPAEALAEPEASLTRGYLWGGVAIPVPLNRRPVETSGVVAMRGGARVGSAAGGGSPKRRGRTASRDRELMWLVVRGARHNNLKNIDVGIPLGRFVCVTGVSGSGKSSLVNDILWPALARSLSMATLTPGEHDGIDVGSDEVTEPRGERGTEGSRDQGTEGRSAAADAPAAGRRSSSLRHVVTPSLSAHIDKVINVDQSPIGGTPSSNPATYTGVFDLIRELLARVPDSKVRGYDARRFSFNRPGGRCESCEGVGQKRIEMHFMPDVWIECDVCRGRRYNPETLEIRYKGRNIADVLEMRVAEALAFFASVPRVRRLLQTLADVGLDYVQLGQPAPTLSGGEAQRVKLAAELGKPDTGRTLYLLDEPTTGLHFDDVRKLLAVIHRLADLGNTVVVVEHNLDVIKSADWVIDLGPEAGADGGYIVAAGTPEQIVGAECGRHAACRMQTAETSGRATGRAALEPTRPPRPGADRRTSDQRSSQPREQPGAESAANGDSAFCILHSAFPSHTAAALAPVLAAGPHETREPYDPAAHAEREIAAERGGFGDVGRGTRRPWQVDGRRWHLEQRTSRNGRQRHWEPAALELVEQLVQSCGRFEPTDWNDRAHVAITAPGASSWFMHALTGGEWLIEAYFHVPRGVFEVRPLRRQIGLKTLDERDDIPAYGDWPRVDLRRRLGRFDAVAVYIHDRREIDTSGFRAFIEKACREYLKASGLPEGRPGGRRSRKLVTR